MVERGPAPPDRDGITPEPGPVGDTTLPDPPERPQIPDLTPVQWARANLFNTWYNALITVVFGSVIAVAVYRGLRFVFVTARWEVIEVNLTNIMVWLWPGRPSLVRPWIALFLVAAAVGFLLGRAVRTTAEREAEDPENPQLPAGRRSLERAVRRLWPFGLLLVAIAWLSGSPITIGLIVVLVATVVIARWVGLHLFPPRWSRWSLPIGLGGFMIAFGVLSWFGGYGWHRWGGLMLTLFLATGGILLSFPMGVALALGRRSSFPVVRAVCVAYIELIRGVPLITLLLMGSLMLGLFLPANLSNLAGVTRALVAITLFTAAYVAEIVRGGLQSVPEGQIEAAQAIGLSPLKQTRLIVLPQALRNVIPALVGQFISLFKDTSLVSIIGLFELLRVSRAVTSQGAFAGQGLLAETLVFASLIYWVFTYTMSRESQRLEKRLGVGER